jgi:hypothetical protein
MASLKPPSTQPIRKGGRTDPNGSPHYESAAKPQSGLLLHEACQPENEKTEEITLYKRSKSRSR